MKGPGSQMEAAGSKCNRRRVMAVAGGVPVVAMIVITAGCESTGNQALSTSTTTTTTTTSVPDTTTPPPPPTEKNINPTGGNLFTSAIEAPPVPSVPVGQHPGIDPVP